MKRIAALLFVLFATSSVLAGDWSHWRGPEQTGVSREKDLPEKFSIVPNKAGNNLIWTAPYGGRSTPIVQGGRVYLINKTGEGLTEQERIMCFDEKDGKVLWQHKFNIFHTAIVSVRLGWTTLVGDPETGNIYGHGTQGLLMCFDRDGKLLWQHSLTEEYGRVSGYGGRITSPIVDGDLVLISMVNGSWGYQAMGYTRFVAFDKRTGNVVWWNSTGHRVKETYYSTPVVANIAGQRLLISGGGDGGVHAFKVRTGEKVWSQMFALGPVNCSPVVDGNLVYIGHGEENVGVNLQGRVVCLDGSVVTKGEPKVVWSVDGLKAKYASPIIADGKLYICDEIGKLYCLDAKTGKQLWDYEYGKNTRGSPVLADGKLYIPEVDSKFHILKPGTDGCEKLHSQFFRKKAGGADIELNGSPAVVNGRVYFMTSDNLYCIGKADHSAKADPIPTAPKEATLDKDNPAHLQIYPADVVLQPNQSVDLKARLYDKNGVLIGEAKVDTWFGAAMKPPESWLPPAKTTDSKPPPAAPGLQGAIKSTGNGTATLTAAAMPRLQFGRVVAKAGELTGEVRVRVLAPLPFAADFSRPPEGRSPAGWVNSQGKFAVVTLKDGHKVLKKLAVNPAPPVARANAYIGMPDLKDYTIECDIMGTQVGDNMPDAGLVASRYTLMLDGNKKQLRLLSWEAIPRVDKTIAYDWKPNTWYRLKLTVDFEGDKGIARGKIWERDQPEPKDWTVEFTDPIPNREGSPAIYGYATGIEEGKVGAEAYYDNLKIYPNKK